MLVLWVEVIIILIIFFLTVGRQFCVNSYFTLEQLRIAHKTLTQTIFRNYKKLD